MRLVYCLVLPGKYPASGDQQDTDSEIQDMQGPIEVPDHNDLNDQPSGQYESLEYYQPGVIHKLKQRHHCKKKAEYSICDKQDDSRNKKIPEGWVVKKTQRHFQAFAAGIWHKSPATKQSWKGIKKKEDDGDNSENTMHDSLMKAI